MLTSLPDLRLAHIRLPRKLTLQYAEQGSPSTPPLILLHGFTDSWFSYSRVLAPLAARHHVFALSQRGHGDSSRPVDGYAMPELAADVVAFMDAQGLAQAAVIGHSMGSIVATELALAAPDRLDALVLMGANTSWNTPELVAFQEVVAALPDPVPAAFVSEFQGSTAFEPLPEAFMERVVAESLKLPAYVWRAALAGHIMADYVERLAAIRMPTLVLGGEEDAYCPADRQRELASRLGNAELKLYPRVGHCPHWERPEAFVQDVEAFLSRVLAS
jgi:non-heme chloroperoxidase